MNLVVLTPTDNPMARARIRRRRGGPARRATRSLVCGKNYQPYLIVVLSIIEHHGKDKTSRILLNLRSRVVR